MIDAIILTSIFLFTHTGCFALGAAYARKRYSNGR